MAFMYWLILLSLFIAHASEARSLIRFNQDVEIKTTSGQKIPVKKDEEFNFSGEDAVMINKEGFVPTILIPQGYNKENVNINLVSVKDWPSDVASERLNTSLSTLLEEIIQIQSLISSKKTQEALEQILTLKNQFPKVNYLHFLSASAHVRAGNKKSAVEDLKKGLAKDPGNKRAQSMLKALEETP